MASIIEKKLVKILECAICLDSYEEPKVLPCQHTYCRKCLEQLAFGDGRIRKVTCPECRRVIKLPRDGIPSLPCNVLINNLMSVNADAQWNASPRCEKHKQDILELYCQVCEQPICQACTEIDHRGHSYKFIKDVFSYEKRQIVSFVNVAKPKISALKAEVASMELEEKRVKDNALEVAQEIDSHIDALINEHSALLEQKRQRLKQDLSDMTLIQMKKLHEQKERLLLSLNSAEAAKTILDVNTNKVEFLRKKNDVKKEITELQTLAEHFTPCEKVVYQLEKKPAFDVETLEETGSIASHGECSLSMRGGERGVLYTGRALQSCEFIIARNSFQTLGLRNVFDNFKVGILKPKAETPFHILLEKNADGTHSFRYMPECSGTYKIRVFSEKISGGEIYGSPFSWDVQPALYLRSWFYWFQNFGFRDYTYLSDCVFEDGQHSWRIKLMRGNHEVNYGYQEIGVTHLFRKKCWCWTNGQHFASGHESAPSPVKSARHGDVFVVFLNIEKRQMIIYNERTKESDIWRDIEVPVTPHLYPDVFVDGPDFSVFLI